MSNMEIPIRRCRPCKARNLMAYDRIIILMTLLKSGKVVKRGLCFSDEK
ncbi:hypothetical protein JOE39_003997 [Pseudomonas sp. PvP100]|nr:hypothetical protein [Pseudomonas sp. PvP007]MBP1196018.1 hypothetical protein [Pseudomonas sp. PvP100]